MRFGRRLLLRAHEEPIQHVHRRTHGQVNVAMKIKSGAEELASQRHGARRGGGRGVREGSVDGGGVSERARGRAPRRDAQPALRNQQLAAQCIAAAVWAATHRRFRGTRAAGARKKKRASAHRRRGRGPRGRRASWSASCLLRFVCLIDWKTCAVGGARGEVSKGERGRSKGSECAFAARWPLLCGRSPPVWLFYSRCALFAR